MEKDGWRIKGKPVENLLMAMRGFAKNHERYQKEKHQIESDDRTLPEYEQPQKTNTEKTYLNYMSELGIVDEEDEEE